MFLLSLSYFVFFFFFKQKTSYNFFFSSRRRHTRLTCDWSSDVCSSDLAELQPRAPGEVGQQGLVGRGVERLLVALELRTHAAEGALHEHRIAVGVRLPALDQIGRASCREGGEIGVVTWSVDIVVMDCSL